MPDLIVDRVRWLQEKLNELDNGVLYDGAHQEGERKFCALEFDAKLRGRTHSDFPVTLPDLRPLNDARWSSNEERTKHLLPVMAAFWDYSEWSPERRLSVISRIVIRTVQEIISELPYLSDKVREECRQANTLAAAAKAAYAANAAGAAYAATAACAAYAATAAAYAATAAAYVADAAAYAADAAGAEAAPILERACRIWTEEALSGELK